MKKVITAKEAAGMIKNGTSLMVGGFLSCGVPDKIIDEIIKQGKKNLTLIANDTSFAHADKGKLIVNKCIKKVITTHIGTNPQTGIQMINGEIEVEIVPMGTLVERIRAKGAGLGGILTPTGVGTILEKDKKVIKVDDKKYIFEKPLGADVAIIYGSKVDRYGNVSFKGTTRNFNVVMATAAETVIVQADEYVESINPNHVVIPGLFVDYIVVREENSNAD